MRGHCEAGDPATAAPWLIVAAGFHFRGGMDRANAQLASYLLHRGAAVHIVAHDVDPILRGQARASVHLVPRPLGSLALGEFGLDRRGREVARSLSAECAATRVIVNGGNCQWPDVNWVHYVHHAWTDLDDSAPLWFKAKHQLFSARWRRAEASALRTARTVITNSDLTSRDVISHFGVAPERVRTIYLGTDGTDVATPEERASARRWLGLEAARPVAAFVGALGFDRRKGFDTLWNAWKALCSLPEWDADLIVAGSGGDARSIAAATERDGLAQRVRILGHTDRVNDVLAAADLLVSPVRYEPYGLNVQEALCRGLPAVVTRCAGVAERYPSELSQLLLNDPDSVEELTGILRRWRPASAEWKARVAALGRELRDYGWDDMSRAFVDAVAGRDVRRPSVSRAS
jgi:glycosyltransferase involved in cell wall biosynthesis